ncbi:MAG: two-component system response regulator [Gemmatales bacterium]|nr:MAG: two-component system response regulator [Gemmatales bacterium]
MPGMWLRPFKPTATESGMQMASHKTVHVLLVEDDEVDVEAVKRSFQKARIANPLHVASDGDDALNILRGQGGKPPLPRPYVVLLDLNMPKRSGLEFLREVRRDPALHDSVVFVLTTSNNENDRTAAYDLNVAGYIPKPKVGEEFLEMVRMLDYYWRVVELP